MAKVMAIGLAVHKGNLSEVLSDRGKTLIEKAGRRFARAILFDIGFNLIETIPSFPYRYVAPHKE